MTEAERDEIDELCGGKMTRAELFSKAIDAFPKGEAPTNAETRETPENAWPGGGGSLPRRGGGAGANCRIPFRATAAEFERMKEGAAAFGGNRTNWMMAAVKHYKALLAKSKRSRGT